MDRQRMNNGLTRGETAEKRKRILEAEKLYFETDLSLAEVALRVDMAKGVLVETAKKYGWNKSKANYKEKKKLNDKLYTLANLVTDKMISDMEQENKVESINNQTLGTILPQLIRIRDFEMIELEVDSKDSSEKMAEQLKSLLG